MRKVALITGASGGIGEELAKQFAAGGFDLVLVARDRQKLAHVRLMLTHEYEVRVTMFCEDLACPGAVQRIAAAVRKSGTKVSILVNNAGFGLYGLFHRNSGKRQMDMVAVNVGALTELMREFLPDMVRRKRGRILNVSSIAAFEPGPLMAVYYATKAYVLSLSLALRNELHGTGVTVTCLCPGPTKTGFAEAADLLRSPLFHLGIMDPRTVARYGYRACIRGQSIAIPGWRNAFFAFLTRFIPRSTAAAYARRIQESGR